MVEQADNILQDKPLHGMFTAVPPRYDLLNKVITWKMDKGWRERAAAECLASQPKRVLDLCCGTGDLAILIAGQAGYELELTGLDFSQPMLDIAAEKAQSTAAGSRINFTRGDAAELPFPDGYFDCIGISFGFRNLTYKNPLADSHISETVRVLSPGGRFVIVESSQPGVKLVRELFHLYLRWFVAGVGNLLSGNKGAYHYLAESAARFYTPEELTALLLTSGFSQVSYRPLFMGVAGIYTAVK